MAEWFEERLASVNKWEGYGYSVAEPKKKRKADLDANENWNVPERQVRSALLKALSKVDVRSYPEGAVDELRKGVARSVGVTADSVVPCTGADQAIDLLCQAFLREGDAATIITPTFSMYRLRSIIAGATCVELPMREGFTLPMDKLRRRGSAGGILFICSPNNPTGTQFAAAEVLDAVQIFNGLVVLDEAYVEFAEFSLSKRVAEFRNLAVLRTFSKAYGLAGLRLGYILANDSWAPEFLGRVQYPYPINSIAAATALTLMGHASDARKWAASVRKERSWLSRELAKLDGVRVADSQANFILTSVPLDSAKAHSGLLRRGVATRDVGDVLGMGNCLRITVGTRSMNKLLLKALKEVL